jgi:hypothetical protein
VGEVAMLGDHACVKRAKTDGGFGDEPRRAPTSRILPGVGRSAPLMRRCWDLMRFGRALYADRVH